MCITKACPVRCSTPLCEHHANLEIEKLRAEIARLNDHALSLDCQLQAARNRPVEKPVQKACITCARLRNELEQVKRSAAQDSRYIGELSRKLFRIERKREKLVDHNVMRHGQDVAMKICSCGSL